MNLNNTMQVLKKESVEKRVLLAQWLVPLGVSVAETDQSSASEERSSKSRQSEMALETRESPKPVPPPNSERMEVTS